jgi:hypothetical protein
MRQSTREFDLWCVETFGTPWHVFGLFGPEMPLDAGVGLARRADAEDGTTVWLLGIIQERDGEWVWGKPLTYCWDPKERTLTYMERSPDDG